MYTHTHSHASTQAHTHVHIYKYHTLSLYAMKEKTLFSIIGQRFRLAIKFSYGWSADFMLYGACVHVCLYSYSQSICLGLFMCVLFNIKKNVDFMHQTSVSTMLSFICLHEYCYQVYYEQYPSKKSEFFVFFYLFMNPIVFFLYGSTLVCEIMDI